MRTAKFVVEITLDDIVNDESVVNRDDRIGRADELFEWIAATGDAPSWLFSFDGVDPA